MAKVEINFYAPVEFLVITKNPNTAEEYTYRVSLRWEDILRVEEYKDNVIKNENAQAALVLNTGDYLVVMMPYRAVSNLYYSYTLWYKNETNKYRFYLPIN